MGSPASGRLDPHEVEDCHPPLPRARSARSADVPKFRRYAVRSNNNEASTVQGEAPRSKPLARHRKPGERLTGWYR